MSQQWELGIIDEKLDRLSDLAGVTPGQFLAAQADFYPATGSLERTEYPHHKVVKRLYPISTPTTLLAKSITLAAKALPLLLMQ